MVNKINTENFDHSYSINLMTEDITRGDNFAASKAVCSLLEVRSSGKLTLGKIRKFIKIVDFREMQ